MYRLHKALKESSGADQAVYEAYSVVSNDIAVMFWKNTVGKKTAVFIKQCYWVIPRLREKDTLDLYQQRDRPFAGSQPRRIVTDRWWNVSASWQKDRRFPCFGIIGCGFVISYGIFTGSSGSAIRAVLAICCLWLQQSGTDL